MTPLAKRCVCELPDSASSTSVRPSSRGNAPPPPESGRLRPFSQPTDSPIAVLSQTCITTDLSPLSRDRARLQLAVIDARIL